MYFISIFNDIGEINNYKFENLPDVMLYRI